MIKGYLIGEFDLFNVADLDVIAQATRRCDELFVAVLSDEDVERLYGRAPVVPVHERCEIVRNLRGVASVGVFSGWAQAGSYDVIFEDPRLAASAAPYRDAPGLVTSLDLPRDTASEVLRGHLNRREEIAEAS